MENYSETNRPEMERARKRVKAIARFYRHFAIYILVNLFLIAMHFFNLETGDQFLKFSAFSTAFFWGIGLAFHALGVFGPNIFLGHDWEERKIRELMDRNKKDKWE